MKRFLRYLLLIGCVVLIGAWGVSYFYLHGIAFHGESRSANLLVNDGMIYASRGPNPPQVFERIEYRHSSVSPTLNLMIGSGKYKFAGITVINMPQWQAYGLLFPIWFLFIPLFLLTLALWYHPIKNWWRGTDRQGFEVEMKNKDSADGK